MTDEQGNAVECKECADVPETPPTSTGYGWCPKVELKLDEPEATDEEMEAIDRDIDEHQDALDAALAADLTRNGKSSVLRDANSVLDNAKDIINNGRKSAYGHPTENFRRIAAGWREILGIPVSHRQIALMMAWLKIARDIESPQRDNLVDGVGYLALGEEA